MIRVPSRRAPDRRITTRIAAATAALGIAGALAAAGPAQADSGGTTLRVASDTQISTFNPFLAYYDGELNILGNIYPTLVQIDAKGTPRPYLADSWKTSSDKKTWTFTIHKGLTWSDGKPLTAKDIAWTTNLVTKNDVAATANGSLVADYASVKAPNDSTIVITTKETQANLLYSSVPIVPEHIWTSKVKDPKNFRNTQMPVVGYGPWKLVKNVTNQYAQLDANKDFFLGAPKFDHLISQYFSNSDAAVAALKNGSLDQLSPVSTAQYRALQKTKGVTTYQTQPTGWTGLEVNPGAASRTGKPIGTGNPILKDQKVRTALAYAIDRKDLVRTVLRGNGTPGSGYWAPGFSHWFWEPTKDEAIGYDPEKAEQILEDAGYAKGSDGIRESSGGARMSFRLGIHSDDSFDAQIAPYLVEWFKAIGVEVKVQPQSFDQLNNNLAKGDWDMLMDGWSMSGDPSYMLSIQTCGSRPLDNGTSGSTDAFFCDEDFDALYKKQLTQFDDSERRATVKKALSILYTANADIMLYYKNSLSAYRSDKVKGYVAGSKDSEGFYPLQNLNANWKNATPVGGATGGGIPAAVWIIVFVVIVVLAVALALVILRRRRTAGDRE